MARQQQQPEKRKAVSEMSNAEKSRLIATLKGDLGNADDPVAKRNIRAQLRRLGHSGGLGLNKGAAKKPAAKANGGGRRAAAAAPQPRAGRRAAAQPQA